MSDSRVLLTRYFRQLKELAGDDLVLDPAALRHLASLAAEEGPKPSPPTAEAVSFEPARTTTLSPSAPAEASAPSSPRPAPSPARLASIEQVAASAAACTACGLAGTRSTVVFGDGDPAAELMVVGEAPGAEEDRTGRPFVGRAGKLLDMLLLSVGFPRESVYICNVLKCRPPGNRNPAPEEVHACSPFLRRQVELIGPKAILAVGTFSAQTLLGSTESIGRLRGKVHQYEGIPLVPTYHPAALLRNPAWIRPVWEDLQRLRRLIDG